MSVEVPKLGPMTPVPWAPSPRRRFSVMVVLAVVAAVASIVLTGAAFWLSYEHLHDVADDHGLSGVRAWAWPGTVDLFILIGEVLFLRASLRREVDPWAILLTIAGSGGSIALNVAGVGDGADSMDYVVAAVPPIAALLAFGALMRQLHGVLSTMVPEPADTAAVEPAADAPEPAQVPAAEPAPRTAPEPQPEPEVQAAPEPPAKPRRTTARRTRRTATRTRAANVEKPTQAAPEPAEVASPAEQVRQVLNLIETHGYDDVKLGFVREQTGMSKTTAYNRLVEARAAWSENQS